MTLRLDEHDDRLLGQRAQEQRRSKQDVAKEAIHLYLTSELGRLEDAEDELAISRYLVRRQLGEVEFISQAEARTRLGLHSS